MPIESERQSVPDTVRALIETEAGKIRATHQDLLAALDRTFDELTPQTGDPEFRLQRALAMVDQRADIDIMVPVTSTRIGGRWIKRVVRSAISWHVRFIAAQVSSLAGAVSRSLHLIAEELDELRGRHVSISLPRELTASTATGPAWWAPLILQAAAGVSGPVLHGDCGDGNLVTAFGEAGFAAYGVEPFDEPDPRWRGLDVRRATVLAHLQSVEPGSLGAVVVQGFVERISPGHCEQVVVRSSRALSPGGIFALASTTPEAWRRVASPVIVDLAAGHPLHEESWQYLLMASGFRDVHVHRGGNDTGTGPEEYLIIATRHRQ